MQYQVLNNLLTGPRLDEAGKVIGRIHAVKGDLLSAEDLRGMDIERLVGLGAIAQSADDAPEIVQQLAVPEPFVFDDLTKRELEDYADGIGLPLLNPARMNRAAMIEAIRAHEALAEDEAEEDVPEQEQIEDVEQPE
jgi:hypothetical protein